MNHKTTPGYYSIITAEVRYDKTISSSQKVLFAEISSLTNKSGVCWASNNYFAELYEVDPSTVSKWIKGLERRGYIKIKYIKEGKQIKQRRIELNQGGIEIFQEGIEINQEGIEKTPKIIIKDNNKSNIKREYSSSSTVKSRLKMSDEEFNKIMFDE